MRLPANRPEPETFQTGTRRGRALERGFRMRRSRRTQNPALSCQSSNARGRTCAGVYLRGNAERPWQSGTATTLGLQRVHERGDARRTRPMTPKPAGHLPISYDGSPRGQ